MAKVKCANCGGEMVEAYIRGGLVIFVCGHAQISTTEKRSRYGKIYCDRQVKVVNNDG